MRSSAARPFRYAWIMGCSVLESSKFCDRAFAMWHDMYASRVSRSEMGRLSVSESGLGMGTRCMYLARCGSSRWMRA